PTQAERTNSVKIKLNAISSTVKGKRVVMIDDSIVRGTTSARIVNLLREAGAKEVHVRISSPPFVSQIVRAPSPLYRPTPAPRRFFDLSACRAPQTPTLNATRRVRRRKIAVTSPGAFVCLVPPKVTFRRQNKTKNAAAFPFPKRRRNLTFARAAITVPDARLGNRDGRLRVAFRRPLDRVLSLSRAFAKSGRLSTRRRISAPRRRRSARSRDRDRPPPSASAPSRADCFPVASS
ncbi:MAG: hypothetical protein IJY15_12815, partial [Thermoguttaceae bacterium]|nr:hypothetical protein [Thermoguttaceae bacterium]